MAMETEQTTDGLVIGRNAVAELLAGGREIEHVLVANGERTGSIVPLVAKCKKAGRGGQVCGPAKAGRHV